MQWLYNSIHGALRTGIPYSGISVQLNGVIGCVLKQAYGLMEKFFYVPNIIWKQCIPTLSLQTQSRHNNMQVPTLTQCFMSF